MKIRPMAGVSATAAVDHLLRVRTNLDNDMSVTHTAADRLEAYRRWANVSLWMLQTMLDPASIRQLIRTDGYFLLHQAKAPTPSIVALLDAEVASTQTALDAAVAQLRRAVGAWRESVVVVVPDTSLLLNHPLRVEAIPWGEVAEAGLDRVDVVILMKVIEELDRAKAAAPNQKVRGDESIAIRTRARTTLRTITAAFRNNPRGTHLLSRGSFDARQSDVYWRIGFDDLTHVPLPVADAEIINQALSIKEISGARVTVATADVGMTLRAAADNLLISLWSEDA